MVKQNKGFSLIELVITLAVLSVIVAMAAPSVSSYKDKRKIISVAEAVYSQLQLARSEAIAIHETVHANFSSNDTTTWAMGISTNSSCDVTQSVAGISDDCFLIKDDGDANLDTGDGTTDTGDLVYYTLSGDDFSGVSLGDFDGDAATDLNEISFDYVRGTAENETIYIKFGTKYEMRVIVYLTGRIRICSPSGTTHVGGYTEC